MARIAVQLEGLVYSVAFGAVEWPLVVRMGIPLPESGRLGNQGLVIATVAG